MRLNFIGKIKIKLPRHKKTKVSPKDIASAEPIEVENYDDLVTKISEIAFDNPHLNLYFRGQDKDHKNKKGQSSLLSQFYRRGSYTLPNKSQIDLSDKKKRKNYLENILPILADRFIDKLKKDKSLGIDRHQIKFIARFDESKWAILQHYGYPTPLLDVTKSIRVAASFATKNYKLDPPEACFNGGPGFVYLLGFPETHGYISYFTYEAIVITSLLGTCPPQAKRPHFQDGYLVGTIPHETSVITDFNNCLVAKFKIDKPKDFWSNNSQPMDISEIYPEAKVDRIKGIADSMKDDFRTLCGDLIPQEKKLPLSKRGLDA
ncbi:MAG TPA: hypothetical protein DD381_01975 [Lentisphaeria bacterium]|nr:MAG: hypothetical protein A2X47_12615 [Lentisphaerae bacterium GWF2_38_69]HBM15108.1 hypothetical protein [Lentisphaeria bacterium]